MILTRRGVILLVTVVAAIGSGLAFGARGLNGIAAPGVVALVAGIIQVSRYSAPSVERTVAPRGHRGESLRVTLDVSAARPFTGSITERARDGLDVSDADYTGTIAETTVTYRLGLETRGEWELGPTEVVARDVLGLVARRFEVATTDSILVFPTVHDLAGQGAYDLDRLYGGSGNDRQEFDQLRHYQRGDPMRDIHWKSSAKRSPEEFIVKQYTADAESRTVEIVATAPDGRADAMADAAASIAAHLLDRDVAVGLTTPSGRVSPDSGPEQRRRILRHLAQATGGLATSRGGNRGDITIRTASRRTIVTLDRQQLAFEDLVGDRVDRVPEERWRVQTTPTDPRAHLEEVA